MICHACKGKIPAGSEFAWDRKKVQTQYGVGFDLLPAHVECLKLVESEEVGQ